MRSIVAVAALGTLVTGLTHAAGAPVHQLAPRLPDLLRRSALVVLGDVGAVTEHDEGRLLQAHLRVAQKLDGAAETTSVEVIEHRSFPSVPPVLKTGRRVLVFLKAAPMSSQLRRSLPEGSYYSLLDERWGLIDLPDVAAERAVSESVSGWVALARNDERDEVDREVALRQLVFSELGARHERLVEDGTAGLGGLPRLAGTLTTAERDIISRRSSCFWRGASLERIRS